MYDGIIPGFYIFEDIKLLIKLARLIIQKNNCPVIIYREDFLPILSLLFCVIAVTLEGSITRSECFVLLVTRKSLNSRLIIRFLAEDAGLCLCKT
jgi:hypothetical protein